MVDIRVFFFASCDKCGVLVKLSPNSSLQILCQYFAKIWRLQLLLLQGGGDSGGAFGAAGEEAERKVSSYVLDKEQVRRRSAESQSTTLCP